MVFRHRNRDTVAMKLSRQQYEEEIKKTFDIAHPEARNAIVNDLNRSEKAKEEDLAFFDDFFGEKATRKFRFSTRDKDYDDSLLAAKAVKERTAARELKLAERWEKWESEGRPDMAETPDNEDVEDDSETHMFEDEKEEEEVEFGEEKKSDGSERKRRRRRSRKGNPGGGGGDDGDDDDDVVLARIPREILQKTAPTAVRFGLSHGAHVAMISAFLGASNVDVNEFPLSYSTSYRRRKEVLEESYVESRTKFRAQVIDEDLPLFLHLDTKELTDTIGPRGSGVKNKRERLGVVLTCPHIEGEQFVCAPGLESTTGRAQADAAIDGLNELGVLEKVVGVNYDTTASNSSPSVGTVALVEEERQEQLLKIPCRHHIYDLFGKNLIKVVTGKKSSGPGNPLFMRFSKEWPNLVETIDYSNLKKLDMGLWRGTFVEQLVIELRVWCQHAYLSAVFPRGSYNDLLNSIIVYIGANPPNFRFHFKKPKDVTNARFMEPAEYYLVLALLSRQLTWLSDAQRQEVEQMAFISALFYGPGFLKSSIGSRQGLF